jgi:hypothetical protein
MATNTLPLFENAGKFYVYVYRDPRPKKKGVVFYVGKGKDSRADVHWKKGNGSNPFFSNVLNKIRELNLEPIIEIIAWFDEEDEAFSLEKALIARYGRRDNRTGCLVNLTEGGDGPSGRIPKESTIELCRAKTTANWRDNEFRSKTVAASRAAQTEEWRDNVSSGVRARYADPEFLERRRLQLRDLREDPVAQEKRTKAMRLYLSSDDYRLMKSAQMKQKWNDEEWRSEQLAKMKKSHDSPDEKARKRSASGAIWEAKREKMEAGRAAAWSDPERRARRCAAISAALSGKKKRKPSG